MTTLFAQTHRYPLAFAPFIGREALRACPAAKWLSGGQSVVATVGNGGGGQDSRSLGGPSS